MSKGFSKYSDKELYQIMRNSGNESETAFAELYSRYSQRIYAYCLRVTGSPEDASDIFQDTFYNFYSSIKNNEYLDNIPAYLLRICRNLCLNFKRHKRVDFNFDDFNFSTNDSSYEQQELLQLIAHALDCLDYDYREAFVLRLYQGLSYNEMSNITGETVPTLKNRFWRAKEKVKDVIL